MRDWTECHEAVVRKGEEQPCDKTPVVALRIDEREGPGAEYPVCAYHTRAPLVPLVDQYWKQRAQALREAAENISHTRCGVDATCHEADVIRLHALADAEQERS